MRGALRGRGRVREAGTRLLLAWTSRPAAGVARSQPDHVRASRPDDGAAWRGAQEATPCPGRILEAGSKITVRILT